MYFKIAVTLYVLYFVTATQSIGLNGDQLTEIGDLYNKYNNGMHNISKDDIEEIGESFGIANMSDFDYKEGESNARKLQDLVVYLANNDKNTDNIKKISMSSFEVRLHVGIFREYDLKGDHKGLLDLDDVKKVIVALDLAVWNNSISYRPAEQCILIVLKEKTKQINALEFLDRIWAVKPNRGTGVNRKQVEDLMTLHNDKTIDGHINPVGIMELFKKISIVKKRLRRPIGFWFQE
ncbi:uncharacterized protein LOC126835597 [Adelges cooleyi]|uniref:uncharacterized protein LOC126835597 n=1 Tax=Adelges cooleyi TaxID=133065 RepID=UPI00217FA959|nr:uncharacterized protein LOC126835597 [Adelges cooleyi]